MSVCSVEDDPSLGRHDDENDLVDDSDYPTDYFHSFDDENHNDGSEDDEGPLSWRMDPIASLSDWTIVISHATSRQEDVYHVHKNILAVGPCKSDYFASLFRNLRYSLSNSNPSLAESITSTSRITLEDSAAESFPRLLDFVYHNNGNKNNDDEEDDDDAQNAVAMRYLSQYFGIRLLYKRVMEFCKKDMDMSNVHVYIQQALLYADEKILSMACDLCVDHVPALLHNERLLEIMNVSFFRRVLSSPDLDTVNHGSSLSTIVATYCRLHRSELNVQHFDTLTDRRYIPLIDKDAAWTLLEMESFYGNNNNNNNRNKAMLSCLQKRCIKVLAQHWQDDLNVWIQDKKLYSCLFYAELLQKVLVQAQQDAREKEQTMRLRHQEETKQLRDTAATLRSELEDKQRRLRQHEQTWSKMHRVSNHTLPFLRKGHSSEPQHPSLFGATYARDQPTTSFRSRLSASTDDDHGYLYLPSARTTTTSSYERWPVFYYKG